MSTYTETETDSTFLEAPSKPKPTLLCVGTVGEVKDSYIKTSEKTNVDHVITPIVLEPLDAGRGITVYFLWRPEYLSRAFHTQANLKALEADNPSEFFVFSKNIASKDELSTLRGLCGSEEAFNRLAREVFALSVDATLNGPTPDDVTELLRNFFANNTDNTGAARRIGYELKQQATKSDEVGSDGKPIYILENRYNLKRFFDVTDKNLKAQKARAERSNGTTIMTYENTPF